MDSANKTTKDWSEVREEYWGSRDLFPLLPIAANVTEHRQEWAECVTLTVTAREMPLFCQPGQFFMVSLPGVGEVPLSVSGTAHDDTGVQFTIAAVGPVTRHLCEQKAGATIGLRGPFGIGWPLHTVSGRDVMLIAGGLGMAPLRPVIQSIIERPIRVKTLTVLCGASIPSSLLYEDDLAEWEHTGRVSVVPVVERPSPTWRGKQGLVTDRIAEADFSSSQTTSFICGPEQMMRAAAKILVECGVATNQMYLAVERNMQCGVGWCGRCQLGPILLCRDGPVVSFDRVGPFFTIPRV